MPRNPVVLIHGYSSSGAAMEPWQRILEARGYDVTTIHTCSYRSLTNEVTLKDIAEGFDRALRIREALDVDQPFDAIVHSTGMLVIRAWLTTYASRRDRLKRLVGLAPATFGSPLAHKGRSWLGAVFAGNKQVGPDFMEAGDRVLDALELGSRFTWDLAHIDLLGDEAFYGPDATTPYVFTLCGAQGYRGLGRFVSEPGTDGTVRWAGCSLTSAKITIDLTRDPASPSGKERIRFGPRRNLYSPLVPIAGVDHGGIIARPTAEAIELVEAALKVETAEEFNSWRDTALGRTAATREKLEQWQQFVVRVVDERGDPIPDFNIQLFTRDGKGRERALVDFVTDVHAYSGDRSLRSFHVNLTRLLRDRLANLWMRVIASSGSQLVGYHGYGSEKLTADATLVNPEGKWDAALDISPLVTGAAVEFFHPFTTTLVEIKLNREPLPLSGRNDVCFF